MVKPSKLLVAKLQAAIEQGELIKAEVCRRTGLSKTNLDRILTGANFSFETAERISEAMEIPLWRLIQGDPLPQTRIPVDLRQALECATDEQFEDLRAVLRGFGLLKARSAKKA